MKARTRSSCPFRGLGTVAILAVFIAVTTSSSTASAEKAAIIVAGKASKHERSMVADAVAERVNREAWAIDDGPFKSSEVGSIVLCLRNDRPWPCISPMVESRQIDRLVIVQLDLGHRTARTPAIVAQLVFPDNDRIPPRERRFCASSCTAAELIELTNDVMDSLFKGARELPDASRDPTPPRATTGGTLTVITRPHGATISIDGRAAGKAGERLETAEGSRTITIELPGYRREQRTLDVRSASDQTLAVELHPEAQRSKVLPVALLAGGGALVLGGIGYGFTLEPPAPSERQPRILVSEAAIAGVALGALAIGAGLYVLLRHDDGPRSTPTASVTQGGAVVGWSRSF